MTQTPHAILKSLSQSQRTLERARIQISNRLEAARRGETEVYDEVNDINGLILEEITKLEGMIDETMTHALYDHPLWDAWLSGLYGVGRSTMPQILAMLLPPLPDRGPSTWYKAAGLITEEHTVTRYVVQDGEGYDLTPVFNTQGEAFAACHVGDNVVTVVHTIRRLPRPRAGGPPVTYYPWLRRCLWLQSRSFVMVGKGYYRDWYDKKKNELVSKHGNDPDWPPHRLDAAARWSMMRLFLAHTWEVWAELEGMPSRKAYVVERLGHAYLPPPRPKRVGAKLIKC